LYLVDVPFTRLSSFADQQGKFERDIYEVSSKKKEVLFVGAVHPELVKFRHERLGFHLRCVWATCSRHQHSSPNAKLSVVPFNKSSEKKKREKGGASFLLANIVARQMKS